MPLLVLPANIGQGLKLLQGINNLAYLFATKIIMHCSGVHHGAPEITCKYWDRLKMFAMAWLARDKHSSLFICSVSDEYKNALSTTVEHIMTLLTLPKNIGLGLKGLPRLSLKGLQGINTSLFICNKKALHTIVEHIVALLTLPVNILG
jgi:hypothetical protein